MDDDERQTELDCIAAIFPELQIEPEFCASLDIPVHPTAPVKVVFPAASDGGGAGPPTPPGSATSGEEKEQNAEGDANIVESHNLSYLPPIKLRVTLPEGYPEEKPAKFELSTSPEWLSRAYLDELENNAVQMWEEAGRSLVVYGYIDSIQQAAENAFGFAEGGKTLEVPQDFSKSFLAPRVRCPTGVLSVLSYFFEENLGLCQERWDTRAFSLRCSRRISGSKFWCQNPMLTLSHSDLPIRLRHQSYASRIREGNL